MSYPVSVRLDPLLTNRNRLTTAFRLILAIPHLILISGIGLGVATRGDGRTTAGSEGGLLGAVAIVLFFVLLAWCLTTIAAWFLILFTGTYPQGLYDFGVGALRWRLRLESYVLLMVDEYPPFSLTET